MTATTIIPWTGTSFNYKFSMWDNYTAVNRLLWPGFPVRVAPTMAHSFGPSIYPMVDLTEIGFVQKWADIPGRDLQEITVSAEDLELYSMGN